MAAYVEVSGDHPGGLKAPGCTDGADSYGETLTAIDGGLFLGAGSGPDYLR